MTVTMDRGLDVRRSIPWIAAAALAAVLAIAVLAGSDSVIVPRSSGGSSGPAEVATNPVPAYVQEGIIYGELDQTATGGAAILPAYVVESTYYGNG